MTNPTVPELAGDQALLDQIAGGAVPDPSVGVIAFAPQPWGTAWTSRHHVCLSLARSFRTVWLSPAPEWRSARPWRPPLPAVLGPNPPVPGFSVDRARWNEVTLYRPKPVADFLMKRRLERVARSLRRSGCRRIVAYLWRSNYTTASRLFPFDLTVIHLDDEHNFDEREKPVSPVEAADLAKVDLVFLSSPQLVDRKGSYNSSSYLFPNGVDLAWYRDRDPIPADLAAIPSPRLGYTGFLRRMVDWRLMLELARRRPDWHLVFVGGRASHGLPPEHEELQAMPNAHFLGYRASREMVAYQQHFDVALLPYVLNAYTDCIYPVKLHEYLAAGAPTVGSPIRSLRDFEDQIELANDLDEWEGAIERALETGQRTPDRIASRWATASGYDWNTMADTAARLIVSRLDRPARRVVAESAR